MLYDYCSMKVNPLVKLENPDCVFVHISKTGGSSIRYGIFKDPGIPTCHDPSILNDYFSFTMIRHPFNRFVSAYKDFTENRGWTMTYEEAIEIAKNPLTDPSEQADPLSKFKRHVLPYTDPYFHLDKVDEIGVFECYQESVTKILKRLKIGTTEIPHLRKTSGTTDWKQDLDNETLEFLREFYEDDLKFYASLLSSQSF